MAEIYSRKFLSTSLPVSNVKELMYRGCKVSVNFMLNTHLLFLLDRLCQPSTSLALLLVPLVPLVALRVLALELLHLFVLLSAEDLL